MAHRVPFLLYGLLWTWSLAAQSITLQVTGIASPANRVVAVVDQGPLAAPLRFALSFAAGTTTGTLVMPVPAGSGYRVRAIAFKSGALHPAVLRGGRVSGLAVSAGQVSIVTIALAAYAGSLGASTPTSAPAGSSVAFMASIADPADSGTSATGSRLYSATTVLHSNEGGVEIQGAIQRPAEAVYYVSATASLPGAAGVVYYQFGYSAWDFNDADGLEGPYVFWPNLESSQSAYQIVSTLSAQVQLTVSNLPATATRVVAVVDQGGLIVPLRASYTVQAGAGSAVLAVAVPAGGPYRLRAIAFRGGPNSPVILRAGKALGVTTTAGGTKAAQIALADYSAAPDAANPSAATAGSTIPLAVSIQDPGDTAADASPSRVVGKTVPFGLNLDAPDSPGVINPLAGGAWQLNAPVLLPAVSATYYYQFCFNAWPFNDPGGTESPWYCWPNLEAGLALRTLRVDAVSGIRISLSGYPATAKRLAAVVDQGGLPGPVRLVQSFSAGAGPATVTVSVPAGGPYRVRVITYVSGALNPVILRSGRATGITVPAGTIVPASIPLAAYTSTIDASTPTSAPPGVQVAISASIQDPGETSAGALQSWIYSASQPFAANFGGKADAGAVSPAINGVARISAGAITPLSGAVLYYQMTYPAWDFSDPNGLETPVFCWPNLAAGEQLRQMSINSGASQVSISGLVTLEGKPAANMLVTLSGARSGTAVTAADGTYRFSNLPAGGYTLTPSRRNCTFAPPSKTVTLAGASATSDFAVASYFSVVNLSASTLNFSGTASGGVLTQARTVSVDFGDNLPLNWLVDANGTWFTATPFFGKGSGNFSVSLLPGVLPPAGRYNNTLTLWGTGIAGTPLTINCVIDVSR